MQQLPFEIVSILSNVMIFIFSHASEYLQNMKDQKSNFTSKSKTLLNLNVLVAKTLGLLDLEPLQETLRKPSSRIMSQEHHLNPQLFMTSGRGLINLNL